MPAASNTACEIAMFAASATERGTTVRTELLAGMTTSLTMSYILFVNPSVLGSLADRAGVQLQFPALLTGTALAATP